MNTKIAVAAGIAVVLAAVIAMPSAAFAADVNVDITQGASTKTTDAYSPYPVPANVGDTIIWTNKDSTIHTATAGDPSGGSTGEFGGTTSSPTLIAPSTTQSYTVTKEGDIPFYCVLHPTMAGLIKVAAGGDDGEPTEQESTATATLDGNTYNVTATSETSKVTAASIEDGSVKLTFDKAGDVTVMLPADMIKGNITATAGGQDVDVAVDDETDDSTTLNLTIPDGQTEVTLMGTFVVPEFPVVAALILGITVAAVVVYTRVAKGSTASFFGRV